MSIYVQKITDYVLVDGNRKHKSVKVTMIGIVLLQAYIGSKKSILVMKTAVNRCQIDLGYYKHLLNLPQRFLILCR